MNPLLTETIGDQTIQVLRTPGGYEVREFGGLGISSQPFIMESDAVQYFGAKVNRLTTYIYNPGHYGSEEDLAA